jgi:uncharacterized protein
MSKFVNSLRSAALVLVLAYAGICAYMFIVQRSLQYRPDSTPVNITKVPIPNAIQETLNTSDGEKVIVWWVAPSDTTQPVFLYFHGNGANLENRAARFAKLTASGAGLLALSYRGYGGSTGTPTEAGLRIDTRRAYDELVNAKKIDPKRIIVFGESLGTTLANLLAADVPVAALLLDSSFDSALDVAARAYPWLPVRLLLLDQFRADLAAAKISAPVQQIHCRDDFVTPLASAERLNARYKNARPIHIVDARCHVPSFNRYDRVAFEFVERVMNSNNQNQP